MLEAIIKLEHGKNVFALAGKDAPVEVNGRFVGMDAYITNKDGYDSLTVNGFYIQKAQVFGEPSEVVKCTHVFHSESERLNFLAEHFKAKLNQVLERLRHPYECA